MRTIKFKAKALSADWVFGNFIHSKRFAGCSNEHRIHEPETGLEHDIMPETVCQFTGILDKNGQEIYENDTMSHNLGKRKEELVVKYIDTEFILSDKENNYCAFSEYNTANLLVTGNIHDKTK